MRDGGRAAAILPQPAHAFCATIGSSAPSPTPRMELLAMNILPEISALAPEMSEWRHHIHAHPETAFEESATAAFVADKLRSFGLEVHTGLARTGVVGVLRGEGASLSTPDAIGLRADLDALHIEERSGVPYTSLNAGRMHACGHDGHTTMLLGAAKALTRRKALAGTV